MSRQDAGLVTNRAIC